MNKDKCEHYNYCCSHELCEECVAVQIIYDCWDGGFAVGITEEEFKRDFDDDDGEILPF